MSRYLLIELFLLIPIIVTEFYHFTDLVVIIGTLLFFIFVVLKPYDSQTSNRAAVIGMFDSFEEYVLRNSFLMMDFT